ncbi:MAG: bifunctional tRNA (5-methylaminomethyl-2-thiouridine)(34)-methyltransferase MnmD/FAD-dependent 5-carboxymethylaminomethyl-2-thiouridine(34) oxidoreductase MnmC [Magnetovibrio sp.]|nr:bifunctional tRNA (5-methylaminomethyl-2-thiouridine)(34)-methyltransferase MnmD/FAD-dependent 5-carboxymethylaminomethyl-2-thiouridine(34) oxidoreductase MnmC [Magnetovibrio sp.]
MTELADPEVSWRDGGTPVSGRFDDIYFSAADGLAESRHVFLDGIGAPDVWAGVDEFTVAELGFGTGLNFLATWQSWRATAPADARLHYVAIEGFPMTAGQALRATAAFGELRDLAEPLNAVLPPRRPGFHRRTLDGGRVTLTLVYAPVEMALDALVADADAWYLDGFAPTRNPAMWSDDVLAAVARRSRAGARLATFSAAGAVRRGLQAVGFEVGKRPGYGAKRECLAATFAGEAAPPVADPWFRFAPPRPPHGPVAVIGAGIAGASAARALADAGAEVVVYDRAPGPAQGASGTPAGILHPRPLDDGTAAAEFYASAYAEAVRTYEAIDGAWLHRGLLALGRDRQDADRYAGFPGAETVSRAQAAARAGVDPGGPGVWFADAGVLDTERVCAGLMDGAACRFGTDVQGLEAVSEGWRLVDGDGGTAGEAAAVICAGGLDAQADCGFDDLGLHANRGQVSFVAPSPETRELRSALTFGGYLTPPVETGVGEAHVLGATFDRPDAWPEGGWRALRDADDRRNLDVLNRRLAGLGLTPERVRGGWAGRRATTTDRLPVVGPVPDGAAYRRDYAALTHGKPAETYPGATYRPGLYVMAGFGARGFVTAPLAGQVLAGLIRGVPLPVSRDVALALHPARFLIRRLRRGPA